MVHMTQASRLTLLTIVPKNDSVSKSKCCFTIVVISIKTSLIYLENK